MESQGEKESHQSFARQQRHERSLKPLLSSQRLQPTSIHPSIPLLPPPPFFPAAAPATPAPALGQRES